MSVKNMPKVSALQPLEVQTLQRHEEVIKKGINSFKDVSKAVEEVKAEKTPKETKPLEPEISPCFDSPFYTDMNAVNKELDRIYNAYVFHAMNENQKTEARAKIQITRGHLFNIQKKINDGGAK